MSIFQKILTVFACLLAAAFSAWLKFGDVGAVRQWWANRPAPRVETAAPVPQEDVPPVQGSYAANIASARGGRLVLHFRRPDTAEETMANATVRVFGADGALVKDVNLWSPFRREPSLGASIVRFTIGAFPAGTYRITADVGAGQPLGIRRAAAEFAATDADSVWADLGKAR